MKEIQEFLHSIEWGHTQDTGQACENLIVLTSINHILLIFTKIYTTVEIVFTGYTLVTEVLHTLHPELS